MPPIEGLRGCDFISKLMCFMRRHGNAVPATNYDEEHDTIPAMVSRMNWSIRSYSYYTAIFAPNGFISELKVDSRIS